MKSAIKFISKLCFIMVLFVLNSCGGNTSIANNAGGDGTITSSYMIRADQISPTPIVNGKPTKFYIYFHNYSIIKVNGLTWSLVTDTSQNETLATKMTSWFSSFMSKNTSNQEMKKSIAPVSIVDASACTSIESASDCRILLSANEVGSGILQGRTESGIVVTSEIPSSYPYITTDDNGNNSLVLSPVSTSVVLDNGLAASSFSVINNSNSLIEVTNLLNSLPAGVSWQLTNCENPLPSNGVCQVRINYTNNTPEIITNTQVNIKLSGNKVNQDGSLEALGNQYSSATINVMTAKVANLQAGYSGLVLDGDNQAKGNSTIAYIKNYGTASASIGKLSIVNSLFTLSDDNCSNHSLNPQEICSYKITANVSGISQAGHITITVPYNNGISSLQTSAILNYDYKKSTNLPVAAAAISLSATNALTQNAPNGIVTVKNTGNVPLAGLTVPIMTPQNPRVVISDPNGCVNNDLLVGASCNFLLTYTPVAPSEDTSIIFGGVSAYYNNQSVSFATTVGTNVSSIFAGHLIISEARLTDSATTKMLTVTNDGNADASISNITISSGNVTLLGGSCNSSMNLKPGNNCDIMVGLSNSNTTGSGNSLLKLTYDNHNGSSATAGSNVNWVIGSATPSLTVEFYPNNNLSTMINGVATTTITLINNGGIALSDIRLPALPITLTYISGGAHPCSLSEQQLNAQNLATGQSCTLILQYSPTTATPQKLTSLGVFTANTGSYISDDYNINLTAISPRIISFDQAILKPSLNWTNSTSYSASVKVSNMSASVVTFEQAVSSDPYLSASGCSGSLASGDSCNLIISGNYPIKLANYEDSGSITVNYSDGINNHSTVLNVDATLAMQPVVTPGLLISGTLPSSLVPAIPTDIEITLTNETTATNGGDTTIKVNLDNLIGDGFNVSNGGGGTISGHLNINGLSNPCSASSGIITLASGASCNINMELTASGTTDNNTTYPQLTITPSFTYNVYSNSSTIPSISSTTNAISPLSGTIMVENPASALDFSTSVTTLSAEQNTTPNPTAVLTVTNVGDTALTSFSLPSINGILFNVPLSCNTLAAHASCDITISLSTTEVLSGNFADNTAYFTDNYHVTNQLVALPNFAYSVTAANIPNIQVTVNTSGCSSRTGGDGLLGTNCYLNPGNDPMMTGNAGALQLVITYTNTASAVAYNFLVAANPPANYTTLQNNCTNITLSKDDSCTLVYILANPSAYPSPSLNVNVATPLDNGYSYNYGIQSQFTGSGGASKPLSNDLQVISSKPSISFNLTYQTMLTNVAQTGSAAISNWFSAATPQVSINSSNSSVATASTPCVINFIGSGGNCNFMINSTATEGNSILNAAISAPDNTLINSSNRPLYTTKFYSYIFGNNSAGNKYLLMCNSSIANCNSANVSFNEPRHIVVNNGYLYVLNTMGNDITKCTINNISGDLTNCSSNNAGQFSNPLDLAFYNGYAYILSTANKVFRCNISSTTGDLTGCSQETNATGFSSANAISFNAIGGVTYAYIITSSDFGLVCQMNPANGSIASCNTSNVLGDGIAFQSGYAYIPSSGKLWVCSISTANGSLNNCVNNLIFNTVSYGIVYYDNYFRITSPNYTLYNVQYSGTTLIGGISSSVYWFGGYLSGIAVSFYPQ